MSTRPICPQTCVDAAARLLDVRQCKTGSCRGARIHCSGRLTYKWTRMGVLMNFLVLWLQVMARPCWVCVRCVYGTSFNASLSSLHNQHTGT